MKSDGVTPNCTMPAADSPACSYTASAEQCFIWEPTVTNDPNHQAYPAGYESYGAVSFSTGDVATIYANGCAQAGGGGQTWHRYVNPHDALHWGAFALAGNLAGPLRFNTPEGGNQYDISNPGYLQLYYNDDPGAYGNNGYWGFDGGDVNECQQSNGRNETTNDGYGGPAFVYVSVQHDTGAPGIQIGSPGAANYGLGTAVSAQFTCTASLSWLPAPTCTAQDGNGNAIHNGDRLDTSSIGRRTITVSSRDAAGRTATQSVSYTVVDNLPPTISISSPTDKADYSLNQPVTVSYSCGDQAGGSGVASCVGDVANGGRLDTSSVGSKSFTVTAVDGAGNRTVLVYHYAVGDVTPPTIALASPADGAVYGRGQAVLANFSCADQVGGSGVASCAGTVADGHPVDTGSLGAKSFTVTAADLAGNTITRTVHYTVVDATPPTVQIVVPVANASYLVGQQVAASYQCQDEAGGSGLASCAGGVPSGSPVDTATPGTKTFTVVARDAAGNQTTQTIAYVVVPYALLPSSANLAWHAGRNGVLRIRTVTADDVLPGSVIILRCAGHGCPHGLRPIDAPHGGSNIVIRRLTGARLRPGVTLTLEIHRTGALAKLIVWHVRRGWQVTETTLCQAPGRRTMSCAAASAG